MALLVAAPLFRRSLGAEGYLLHCQSSEDSVLEVIAKAGIGSLTANKPLVVPLAQWELDEHPDLGDYGSPNQLIPLLGPDVPSEIGRRLNEQGYHVCVHGESPQSLAYADYWLFNQVQMQTPARRSQIGALRKENFVTAIATGVDSWADFDTVWQDGFELLEGRFYCASSPLVSEKDITPVKANLVRLLNIVRDSDYEFATLTNVVRQDPALTVSLMRFINSPYIGVRNRVRSIQQAVTLLGQDQVRKWITAALFKSLGADQPGELTRVSLVRAMFAENLAPLFKMTHLKDSLFLTGLFSILDVILGVTMEQALNLVPVDEEIENTLLGQVTSFRPVLSFIDSYEIADWYTVASISEQYGISREDISHAYLGALTWYNDLIYSSKSESSGGIL